MLKSISNLGTSLSKTVQKQIIGGECRSPLGCGEEGKKKGRCAPCSSNSECASGVCANNDPNCSGGKRCF